MPTYCSTMCSFNIVFRIERDGNKTFNVETQSVMIHLPDLYI